MVSCRARTILGIGEKGGGKDVVAPRDDSRDSRHRRGLIDRARRQFARSQSIVSSFSLFDGGSDPSRSPAHTGPHAHARSRASVEPSSLSRHLRVASRVAPGPPPGLGSCRVPGIARASDSRLHSARVSSIRRRSRLSAPVVHGRDVARRAPPPPRGRAVVRVVLARRASHVVVASRLRERGAGSSRGRSPDDPRRVLRVPRRRARFRPRPVDGRVRDREDRAPDERRGAGEHGGHARDVRGGVRARGGP